MHKVIIPLVVFMLVSCVFAQKQVLFLAGAGQYAGGPKDSDDIVIETLEDLGYIIEYYWLDDASKMTDDLGLDHDLVVVSSTVSSGDIGDFYMDKAVPVLTWEMGMFGKLGIASGGSNMNINESFITIIGEGHPALGEFIGDVDVIFSTPMEFTVTDSARLSPGAQVLAQVVGDDGLPKAAIFVVEEGDMLVDSTACPARRLSFFFRDETAIEATDEALALLGLCTKWTVGDAGTSVEDLKKTISDYRLFNNYPNPFNPATHISFTLEKPEHVTLTVFNGNGRIVKTLISEPRPAGTHTIQWNGTTRFGGSAPSGVYFYKLTAGQKVMRKKMLLMK